MFKPFPGYQRRRELYNKIGLTDLERQELKILDEELDKFRWANPDWQAGLEPMKVTLGDLIKARK